MKYIFILLCSVIISTYSFATSKIQNLAQVYNKTITEHDIEDRIEVLAVMNRVPVESLAHYKNKLLQDMIKEEVFLYQAKKLKIKIHQQEVDQLINLAESSRNQPEGTLQELIKKHPAMEASFKAQIVKNQILQSYIMPKIFVTELEVEKQLGSTKKTILASIAAIEISGEDIEKKKSLLENIEEKVTNCAEFEKYAQDNNLTEVIYINNKIDDLNESLKNFVANVNIGQVTNLLQIEDKRYQMLMLCDKKLVDNGKKSKEEIREDIFNKKVEDAVNNYYLTLARKANIIVYHP